MDEPEKQQPENKEVFRGHLDECVEHLAGCLQAHVPKGTKGVESARQPIADFCGVNNWTAKTWLDSTGSNLIGDGKIKMMCFLSMMGYYVFDFEQLGERRRVAELIGYSVLTAEEIANLVPCGTRGVYRYVFFGDGERKNQTKKERLQEIARQKREELAQKKEEARVKYRLSFSLLDSVRQKKVSAVMSIMQGLQAMLESSEVGDPFAESLRNLPPSEKRTLLRLSEHLNSLSVKLARDCQQEEADAKQ